MHATSNASRGGITLDARDIERVTLGYHAQCSRHRTRHAEASRSLRTTSSVTFGGITLEAGDFERHARGLTLDAANDMLRWLRSHLTRRA